MPRSTSTCWGALPQPASLVPLATIAHDPPPPCNTTVRGGKLLPDFATRRTAAHDESTAASRHSSTCAPSRATATPASIAARIAPPSAPQGSGNGGVVVLATVVVVVG